MQRIATDCGKCNGILVSPDQKTLYTISNDNGWFEVFSLKEGEKTMQGAHMLLAYDLSPEGTVINRRVVIDYGKLNPPCSGPDGMVADVEGNIMKFQVPAWRTRNWGQSRGNEPEFADAGSIQGGGHESSILPPENITVQLHHGMVAAMRCPRASS